jgi:SNF2 family DNA or RNA helicase
MTPQQTKAFKDMKDKAVTVFAAGEVTAPNAAVVLSKLLQICCGVVYGDNQTIAIDATARYNTLTELLDEIGDKVIIYVPLKGVQNWLFERLQIDKYDVALVNGDTSKKNRDQIFNDFQHTDSIRILLAHPKVAAHGLTLTRAKDIIWYAPIYSLEQYEQANARIRRLSTTGKTTVWHIWATEFEAELYRRLRLKQNTLAEFLALVQGVNSDQ